MEKYPEQIQQTAKSDVCRQMASRHQKGANNENEKYKVYEEVSAVQTGIERTNVHKCRWSLQ